LQYSLRRWRGPFCLYTKFQAYSLFFWVFAWELFFQPVITDPEEEHWLGDSRPTNNSVELSAICNPIQWVLASRSPGSTDRRIVNLLSDSE